MAKLSPSAQRVEDALAARGMPGRVRELPSSTRSAAEAAAAIDCDLAQIAKSMVFRGSAGCSPVLVVASGRNRVDEELLSRLLGEEVDRPDAAFVRQATGYSIGGVPPIAHDTALRTIIDRDLMGLGRLWAAAGTPTAVFWLDPDELLTLTGGTVADIRKLYP